MPARRSRAPFTALTALAALMVTAACAGPSGAEEPPPPPPPQEGMSEADRIAIAELFSRFSQAMELGSVDAISELLSPSLPASKRDTILADATSEFDHFRYPEYALVFDRHVLVSTNDDGTVRIEPVRASYRYESRSSSMGPTASEGENSFYFLVEKSGDRWCVVHSDLFDTFARWNQAKVFSWFFFLMAVGVVATFFWGWMVLDCSIRYRNWTYSIALLLTFPIGALYYFFAVWLRRPAGEIGE